MSDIKKGGKFMLQRCGPVNWTPINPNLFTLEPVREEDGSSVCSYVGNDNPMQGEEFISEEDRSRYKINKVDVEKKLVWLRLIQS